MTSRLPGSAACLTPTSYFIRHPPRPWLLPESKESRVDFHLLQNWPVCRKQTRDQAPQARLRALAGPDRITPGQLPVAARTPWQSPEQQAEKPRLLAPLQPPSLLHASSSPLISENLQSTPTYPSLVPDAPQTRQLSGAQIPAIPARSPIPIPSPGHAGQETVAALITLGQWSQMQESPD